MAGSETAPIEKSILVVRGQRVILAADLAKIYGVETPRTQSSGQAQSGKIPRGFYISIDPQ